MKDFFSVFFKFLWILFFVLFLWIIHFININFDLNLTHLGILPRTASGMIGILFSPLIHSSENINHILNNTAPFLILSWTLFFFYKPIAWRIFVFSWLIPGIFVWISARNAFHVGISGVLYSLLFFIFFSGVFRKELRLLTVALFVVFLYGSMVWGIFPYDWRISFESHFFGSITGLVLAYFYREEKASFKIEKTTWEIEEELGIEPPDFESTWKDEL